MDRPLNRDELDEMTKVMQAHAENVMSRPPEPTKSHIDKNCLSYWFPILEKSGAPVPKTAILEMPEDARRALFEIYDGKPPGQLAVEFAAKLRSAAEQMGFPCFLRTGQTSAKHNWKNTCYLREDSDVMAHMTEIVEFSEMADILGLPWHTWVVREFLKTEPLMILSQYGDFPLVKEVRCFIRDGLILCTHPYWPERAVFEGLDPKDDDDGVDAPTNAELAKQMAMICGDLHDRSFIPIAQHVANVFNGDEAFSVDLLPTANGWYVTDMALANRSFHWEGCPNQSM